MKDITIPPEALEAAAIDLYRALYPKPDYHSWADTPERMRELMRRHARAAILAALEAWPGMDTKDGSDYWVPQIIILPLPQETSE